MSSHTDSLKNIIERRRALNLKLLNVSNEISFYNLAPHKRYSNGYYSPLDFPPRNYHKYRKFNRYDNERQEFNNSYRGNRRFQPSQNNMLFKYPQQFPKSNRKSFKFRKNKFVKKNHSYKDNNYPTKKCCLVGAYYECDCDKKKYNNDTPSWKNYYRDGTATDWTMGESTENRELIENPDPTQANFFSYCLDRETQHTIHRIQNDFRLTEKYKAFVLCEMPLINEFKPMPVVTRNKLHDRFKCLFKQILEEKEANADADDADKKKENLDEDILLERTADIDII